LSGTFLKIPNKNEHTANWQHTLVLHSADATVKTVLVCLIISEWTQYPKHVHFSIWDDGQSQKNYESLIVAPL
jgi:hypothetical protein